MAWHPLPNKSLLASQVRPSTPVLQALSTPTMVAVYCGFALGLVMGSWLTGQDRRLGRVGRLGQTPPGERRHASDRRQRPRRANEMASDRRRWRAGQPAMLGEGAPAWPWPEGSTGSKASSGNGDGGTGESWSATVTTR